MTNKFYFLLMPQLSIKLVMHKVDYIIGREHLKNKVTNKKLFLFYFLIKTIKIRKDRLNHLKTV